MGCIGDRLGDLIPHDWFQNEGLYHLFSFTRVLRFMGQGISQEILSSRDVFQAEIEPPEIHGPPDLLGRESTGDLEGFQILVVSPDLEW